MSERAARFRALHDGLVVVANAWDVVSARTFEAAGAVAIGTSSAALAWSHGYPDGEHLPLDALIASVAAMARAVAVPLTVDLERGYADDPAAVARAAVRVVEAGAVGVNLEDGAGDPGLLMAKIQAVRALVGPEALFVNARTCVVLRGTLPPGKACDEVLARARRYTVGGADGLFVPRLIDPAAIAAVARGTALPLNVMAGPGLGPLPELRSLGVRRLSLGPRLAERALSAARQALVGLLERGDVAGVSSSELSAAALNALFQAR
jgi:2-methylisocitrate lyase-like PEP mutase family enzyme